MIFNLVWLPARQTGSSTRTKVLLRIMLRDTTVCEDDLVKQALKATITAGRNLLGRIPKRWLGNPGFGIDSARRPLLLLVLAAAIPILLFGFWASYLSAEKRRSEIRRDALERVAKVAERVSEE